MKINKNELKQSAVSQISAFVLRTLLLDEKRIARRIEHILRASINHLSYELCMGPIDGKDAIYLKKNDRIIVIERNPDTKSGTSFHEKDIYFPMYTKCEWAFRAASKIITQIKGDLAKNETETTNESSSVCAR